MSENTKTEIQQRTNHPSVISLEDTSFSVNYLSLGLIIAVVAWGFRVWLAHDKRITNLETDVEQNTKEIAANKESVDTSYHALMNKIDSLSTLKSEMESLRQEVKFLSISVEKDLGTRNQTIDETKSRVFNLENNSQKVLESISGLSALVNNLYNQMAQVNPMIFCRRKGDYFDHDNPPSNPANHL